MGFMPTFGVAKGEALCGSTLGARRKYMVVDKTSVHNMAIMENNFPGLDLQEP